MNEHRSLFQRWPADRFFWALLDTPGLVRPGPLPEALYAELADELPVPVDEVFAVVTPTLPKAGSEVPFGQVVVCAMRRAELDQAALTTAALVPDAIPPELGVEASASSLNLLAGEYEPRQARVERFKVHLFRGLAVLAIAGLLAAGWARRAATYGRAESEARGRIAELLLAHAPGHDPLTAELAIRSDLARARRAAEASGWVAPPPDAALWLQDLLLAWPAAVPSRPESISITPAAILASVTVEGDPSAFLAALRAPPAWTLEEPRMNAAGGLTRLSLSLTRAGPGAPPHQ